MLTERNHDNRSYVNLTGSEEAVLAAASRIFAAYIIQGKLEENSESQLMNQALKQAIYLAKKADKVIQSGGEM
jgi:hypothetical protein